MKNLDSENVTISEKVQTKFIGQYETPRKIYMFLSAAGDL